MSRFEDFTYRCIWSLWHVYLEMYVIYPLRSCLNFYACYIWVNFCRRDIYFLNNCIIRVFYRFNRNRALHTTLLISCTLPSMDSREAFQAASFILTLSAIGWRWDFLGLPLKIGTPKYVKGRAPILNPIIVAILGKFMITDGTSINGWLMRVDTLTKSFSIFKKYSLRSQM